jgi:outer membrane receptor protein involved in Fe transport
MSGNKHNHSYLAVPALTLLGAGIAAVASAEPTSAEQSLQEVVVTATRQEVGLSKVPISVAVFTQEKMDAQSVRSVEDLVRLTPGVNFERSTDGNTQSTTISIRGISSGAGTATVGVYIDETPVQIRPDSLSSTNPYPQIFDLERVEVLRGPQGTLFGAGSEGGTIRFITPTPSLTRYSAVTRSEAGFTKNGGTSFEIGGAMGGPVVDNTLGFRLSADYRRNGGWVDRIDWNSGEVVDKDANWNDVKSVHASLLWAANDRLTLTPSIYYQDTKINDSSVYWEGYSNPDKTEFINGNPVRSPTTDHFSLSSLKLEYRFDHMNLVANASYLDRSNRNVYDASTLDLAVFTGQGFLRPPPELWYFRSHGDLLDNQKVATAEVRLQNSDADARLNWVAGAFYQHTKQYAEYFVISPFLDDVLDYVGLPFHLSPFFYKGTYLLYDTVNLTNKELAGYVNLDFKLTDKLKLTAGARVSNNKYENTEFGAGPVLGGESTTLTSTSETPITPKFGVAYQLNDANLLYASAAKGYRQGSAAGAVSNACQADATALGIGLGPRKIEPDYVWSYEIGSKNRLWNNRLSLDTSAYQINWYKIQSSLFLPTCNVPITANFGEARSRGVDFNLNLAATDSTLLGLALGYSDAKYTTDTRGGNGAIIRPAGEPLPIAPWTVTLSGEQSFNLAESRSYVRADFQYRSKNNKAIRTDLPAVDPTIPRPPSSKNLDLRAGMRFDSGFDVSVFVQNLTNDTPAYSRNRDSLTTFNYRDVTVRPRTIGLSIMYRK